MWTARKSSLPIVVTLLAACGDGTPSVAETTGGGDTTGTATDATTTGVVDGSSSSESTTGTSEGTSTETSSESSSGGADTTTTGGPVEVPMCDELLGVLEDYRAAHPGNDGQDWDINAKDADEIAADPVAQALFMLCGEDQRPVFPLLAWEYGGSDHPWIAPEMSALLYCVYTPVSPSTEHWAYDEDLMNVTADVYIVCPELNPCNDEVGADQVLQCAGDLSNMEILVDIASFADGADAGLSLSRASTDLNLILEDQTTVHLWTDI